MNLFSFPIFCCTMILPVIFVGHRVVKGVPYNSFVLNHILGCEACELQFCTIRLYYKPHFIYLKLTVSHIRAFVFFVVMLKYF